MEILSDAAVSASEAQDAVPLAAEGPRIDRVPPIPPPAEPAARRKYRTKLQKAQDDLAQAVAKVASSQAAGAAALEAALVASAKKEIDRLNNKAMSLDATTKTWELKAAEARDRLKTLEAQEAVAAASAAAEQAKKDAELDAKKIMTDEGICLLVRTRLSMQAKFDNKTDKNDNIWEHVKAKFDEQVKKGKASMSDIRKCSSLKSKYSRELGLFRQYSGKQHRAVASGASREAVGMPRPALPMPVHSALLLSWLLLACADAIEDRKTCASDIFYEFKVQNRPGVIPPYSINCGNAFTGGQENLFDENGFPRPLPPADGEEEDGEVDEDDSENARPQDQDDPFYDDPLYDGVPRDYPSTQHARASDTASTASGTTSGASSTGSKRAPKALNIGGSSGARKKTATPRNAGAAAATVMVTALGKFRVLDDAHQVRGCWGGRGSGV